MLCQEILDALRLLLGPFWDRSRAMVALRGLQSIASSFYLHLIHDGHLLSQLTSKVKLRRTAGEVTDDSSCSVATSVIVGSDLLEGQTPSV